MSPWQNQADGYVDNCTLPSYPHIHSHCYWGGPIIGHILHLVFLAADVVDRQLGLVVARGGYSRAFEILGQI